jgi:hypothetical protein
MFLFLFSIFYFMFCLSGIGLKGQFLQRDARLAETHWKHRRRHLMRHAKRDLI